MNINYNQLRKWIRALDSGKYKQGKYGLDVNGAYCCLGVACKVIIPDEILLKNHAGFILGTFPSHQPYAPEWLTEIDNDFCSKTGRSLSALNDTDYDSFTFPEIATLLELVYIHKILD